MLGTLCQEGVAELMGDMRALYEQHERDAGDTILMAFKAENWTKVRSPGAFMLNPLLPLRVQRGKERLIKLGRSKLAQMFACSLTCKR
jgi:hypothetical protein